MSVVPCVSLRSRSLQLTDERNELTTIEKKKMSPLDFIENKCITRRMFTSAPCQNGPARIPPQSEYVTSFPDPRHFDCKFPAFGRKERQAK